MARVVDYYPSSEDELPELDALLRKPVDKKTTATPARAMSARRDLVPKSTAKPSVRRIRRLDGGSQLSNNQLLQRFNPDDDSNAVCDSPTKRGRPAVRLMSTIDQSTLGSRPGSPTPQSVVPRSRQRTAGLSILDGSDDEGIVNTHDRLPRVKSSRLLSLKTPSRARLVDQSEVFASAASKNLFRKGANARSVSAMSFVSNQGAASDAEKHSKDVFDDDGSSYQTVGEDGSDILNDSGSQSSFRDLSVVMESIPPIKIRPALQPRNEGMLNREMIRSPEKKPPHMVTSTSKSDENSGHNIDQSALHDHADSGSSDTSSFLAEEMAKLQLHGSFSVDDSQNHVTSTQPESATPSTPPKLDRVLMPTTKQIRIPRTPHRPSADAFWNQELVDGWNEQHSPRKLVLPSPIKSPIKMSPGKEAKKEFDSKKHNIAQQFFQDLDAQITKGQIAVLAESTGGVNLIWSKTLNTTAGRANWRRETIRTTSADGEQKSVEYKHHASIELAEKVIDDENRLLNVVAHEFCHLANFMVNGITNNPHGKEFKVWATKCTRTFGERGIKVTTKHTYEIAFKYVWECVSCGHAYKRHSRSIDPQKHRCAKCKNSLKQIKPAPRGGGKPSEYQAFVKEQMKVVRAENPGVLQKDVMRIIAEKWAKRSGSSEGSEVKEDEQVIVQVEGLSIEEVA